MSPDNKTALSATPWSENLPGSARNAVLSKYQEKEDSGNILDDHGKINAVSEFYETSAASALSAACKRIANILRSQNMLTDGLTVSDPLLVDAAEKQLASAWRSLQPEISAHRQAGDYRSALLQLGSIKEPIDRFFDEVMVVADDPALKNNRLALLRQIFLPVQEIADLSCLYQISAQNES